MSSAERKAIKARVDLLEETLLDDPLPAGARKIETRIRENVYRLAFSHQGTEYYITYEFHRNSNVFVVRSLGNWEKRYDEHMRKRIRDLGRNE